MYSTCMCVCVEQVLVEYMDYGNEELVDKTKLRPGLDIALFSLPPQVNCLMHTTSVHIHCMCNVFLLQVVKCKLAGIPPPKVHAPLISHPTFPSHSMYYTVMCAHSLF